jgi:hypothetical protein
MTTKVEWVTTLCGCGCGVTFRQLRDPGREREYLNNAHKQRAYRARNPHKNHSGTRKESASARQKREAQEAWEKEKVRQEEERQRSYKRHHDGEEWRPPQQRPSWCSERFGDDPLTKTKRRRAQKLWERAVHPGTKENEARACWERAERIVKDFHL